jgi:hypothetical protein
MYVWLNGIRQRLAKSGQNGYCSYCEGLAAKCNSFLHLLSFIQYTAQNMSGIGDFLGIISHSWDEAWAG